MNHLITFVARAVLRADVDNPLDGVTPNINAFGNDFSSKVTLILSGLWALALALTAGAVLWNGAKWGYAAKFQHSPEGAMEGSDAFRKSLMAFAVVAGASVILGVVLFIVQG